MACTLGFGRSSLATLKCYNNLQGVAGAAREGQDGGLPGLPQTLSPLARTGFTKSFGFPIYPSFFFTQQDPSMKKQRSSAVILVAGLAIFATGQAQASQYPMMDTITEAVIKKYQDSSCSALAAKQAGAPPAKAREAIVSNLKRDPKMRAEFINRVAGPIANRLFDCGLIP